MKKLILFTIGSFVLLLTACTRTYTCACTDGTPHNIVYTMEIEAKNKSEAKEDCNSRGVECGLYSKHTGKWL